MANKKRLFIHIGAHKTATTHIQSTLFNNKKFLDKQGILYPVAGRIYEAHFKLCWDLKNSDLAASSLDSLPNWAQLLEEIDSSPHDTVVISSEEFEFGLDPSRLQYLADKFVVTVIFYLRSPDDFLESFYNQVVKDFGTRETRTLERYVCEQPLFFMDTMKLLRPWIDMFGNSSIALRLFGKKYLKDGVIADFLNVLGVKLQEELNPPSLSILHKVSLQPDALEYLRFSNPYLTNDKGHHQFVTKLVQIAEQNKEGLRRTRAGLLSLKAKRAIRSRFRDSNSRAAQLFLGMSKTPFPVVDARPHPNFENMLPEATSEIMGSVAAMIRNGITTEEG